METVVTTSTSKLAGRIAIVTGGGSSIGLAFAKRLATDGATVVIADIADAESAAELLVKAGHRAFGLKTDVSSESDVQRVVQQTIERFGKIDVLVNNAAISKTLERKPFEALSVADWRKMLDVNTIGVFLCCRATSPHMRANKYGRIINVTSGTAFKGAPMILHYVASKGAVMSMTRSLARELGNDGITVNAISPGYMLSAGNFDNPEYMRTQRPKALGERSIPREGYEDDLVGALSFLASDDASFITGEILAVDGGSVYH